MISLAVLSLVLISCRVYEVDPGHLVRSPQPKKDQLQQAFNKYGIRTVINLRGANPGAKWYDDEKEVTAQNAVTLVDIPMSASRLPHRRDLLKLLDTYRNSPKPILIHCLRGIDRTGEAAALYELIYMKKTKEEALKMLSLEFGYMGELFPAKKYFIKDVWVDEDWAYREYDPCSGKYKHYDVNDPVCHGGEPAKLTEADDT